MKKVIEKAAIVFGILTAVLFGLATGIMMINASNTIYFVMGVFVILFVVFGAAAALMEVFTKERSEK
jgi:hypothetical protein